MQSSYTYLLISGADRSEFIQTDRHWNMELVSRESSQRCEELSGTSNLTDMLATQQVVSQLLHLILQKYKCVI